jgi:PhzF family phenazine biosynthesis protein
MQVNIVNAFTQQKFGGNPAAVVPLEEWLPDSLLQQIANQHNLSETAFVVPEGEDFAIRWFTPTVEVDLCGHATLAAAHIYFTRLAYPREKIRFQSRSGQLEVVKAADGKLTLNFPANPPVEIEPLAAIEQGLKIKPAAVFQSSIDYMAVFEDQAVIEGLRPDFKIIATIPSRGLIATAPGKEADFVSRCFYPQFGIDEDPVTGSAHTIMAPYWAGRLGKNHLSAIQLSRRGGLLECVCKDDRVLISGYALTYLEGKILI